MALVAALACSTDARGADAVLDEAAAGRFAQLALTCVHREYPNKIAHVLGGDADVRPPRSLTPIFYGCYDWHSSVHGHWLLARLAREFPAAPFAAPARAALAASFTEEKVAAELAYLQDRGTRVLRAPVRARLAAATDRRASRLGRCRRAPLGRGARAARSRGREPHPHLVAQASLSDPRRRTLADGIRIRAHPGLVGRRGRRGDARADRRAQPSPITPGTSTARWRTSHRARTSCRLASPRRT